MTQMSAREGEVKYKLPPPAPDKIEDISIKDYTHNSDNDFTLIKW